MKNNFLRKKIKGFSIVEVIVSISIIAILTAVSVAAYGELKKRSSVDVAAKSVVGQLRYAQLLSRGIKNDKSWGVSLSNGKIIVFAGASYGNRDVDLDQEIELFPNVSFSGETEIVFDKVSGVPNVSGDIDVSNGSNSRRISINKKGVIEW